VEGCGDEVVHHHRSLPGIFYTSGEASMQLRLSDGQPPNDDALVLNSEPFVAAGRLFRGDMVPSAGGRAN
jgi:hypothetical protein